MWLIVGLGNPGNKYKNNRHNIGFMAVDSILNEYSFSPFKSKFQGLTSDGRINGGKVILLKPSTYMNDSGRSVGEAAKFYKIVPENILVIHDELDIVPMRVKVKKGGGAGGHNGLKSIDAHLGSKDYWRLRLGIGHPGDKNRVSGYVLNDFSKEEKVKVEDLVYDTAKNIELLFDEDQSSFISNVIKK